VRRKCAVQIAQIRKSAGGRCQPLTIKFCKGKATPV
jgi:hypothetical protein